MAKSDKKKAPAKPGRQKSAVVPKKRRAKPAGKTKKFANLPPPEAILMQSDAVVLDRLFAVVESRRDADPNISHSARLLSRGAAKVAQKFGEEAVECVIEAVAGNRDALIGESADVLYHLLVLWVSAGLTPTDVWTELMRREGISGIAEKAARAKPLLRLGVGTSKIP